MASSVWRRRNRRLARSLACAASSGAWVGGSSQDLDTGGESETSLLGSAQDCGLSGSAVAGTKVAGGEQRGRVAEAAGPDGTTETATAPGSSQRAISTRR